MHQMCADEMGAQIIPVRGEGALQFLYASKPDRMRLARLWIAQRVVWVIWAVQTDSENVSPHLPSLLSLALHRPRSLETVGAS